MVVADFQEVYGLTLTLSYMQSVRWSWMRTLLYGLLSTECRVQRLLAPVKIPQPGDKP